MAQMRNVYTREREIKQKKNYMHLESEKMVLCNKHLKTTGESHNMKIIKTTQYDDEHREDLEEST
jgi:tRNA-binding EMAP/Myf-like protein